MRKFDDIFWAVIFGRDIMSNILKQRQPDIVKHPSTEISKSFDDYWSKPSKVMANFIELQTSSEHAAS